MARVRRNTLLVSAVLATLALGASAKSDLSADGTVLNLPAIDAAKALREDEANDKSRPGPRRYALGHAVESVRIDATTSRGGRWRTGKDARLQWELEVRAPGALSIDLGFKPFRLPSGAELKLIDARSGVVHATFTDADNPFAGEFWTPLVRSDAVRLELSLPAAKREFLQLGLDTVHHGYRPLFATRDALGEKSGSCNVDVVCAEGNAWRDQIRSVAVVAFNNSGNRSGNGCSGQFVNSTAPSGGPLFLSANHCEIDAASARVYFNFQNSVCRTPGSAASGQDGDGPLNVSLFGGTLLALTNPSGGVAASDFYLMRFNSPAPSAANLFLSGWDRRDLAPANGTGIHHPSGDEKRISFENQALSVASYLGETGTGTTHLRVADWDLGTTEPGSSGSGLWNSDKRLVGVLSGGQAACGNDLPDWYGRLAHAWEGLGTADRRLRDWLDNGATQAQTLDGRNACALGSVSVESAAFTSGAEAGANVTFTASASGASGGVTYAWDVDGDGVTDRRGPQSSITVSYPRAGSYQVRVGVADASGCDGLASRALDVRGPALAATAGAAQQVCGDNDGNIEPGERWRVPVTLRNNGNAALGGGARALFTPGAATSGVLPIGPNSFGYRATTTVRGGCGFEFVDIAAGGNAVPALATSVANGNTFGPLDDARTTQTIALGGSGFRLYGQTLTQAVMSTNGYVSFSATESGGDFSNDCDGGYNNGAAGPQLRVHHDDLVVSGQAGAGLRYRYFASCPRQAESDRSAAQGCHVFQWSRMQTYSSTGAPTGDFEFQAIAYERSGQVSYQYRSAAPDAGASATIGISNAAGNDPLNTSCEVANAAPASSAVCIFAPNALNAGLRLESPSSAVPALAPGAQATVDVPIAIRTDATCGAPLALDYFGTAAPNHSTLAQGSVLNTTLGGGSACQVSNNCAAQVANFSVRPGLYSNPQRPGNGIAHFVYGAVYGSAWYTALPDRTPTWFTLTGDSADHFSSAPVVRFFNAAAPGGFNPLNDTQGRAWTAQVDNDSVLYGWRLGDGRSGLELMDAVPLPFATPNHSQVWFAPSESGWGLAIEGLATGPGSALEFIGAYVYDSNGVARWMVGDSTSTTGGNVALTLHRPHCPACPWFGDWESQGASAGSLNRTYTGPTSGTLSTSINLPAPLSGTWIRTNLPITTIGAPAAPQR